jgi:drug/metabolite transporter (DMT)-like permease
MVGARVAMLIQALAPMFAAVLSWILLAERLGPRSILGMGITLTGVALVILTSRAREPGSEKTQTRLRFSHSPVGLLLALGAAVATAAGMVFSKMGMGAYDAFAATQIRVIAGTAGFLLIYSALNRGGWWGVAIKNRRALALLSAGAVFGPFLGVSFGLLSIQRTAVGIAFTLMSLVPVLIIPTAVVFGHERVRPKEIFGAVLAVAGASIFFL